MHLHARGTISVNTVMVNTILQFVLLIKISYIDLTISLQIIWQIIKPTFYCKQAALTVTDLHKQNQTKINALFDTCSQRTYVSEELRHYLKLPVLRKEKIIIKIFGTEDTCLKTVDVVPLKLLSSSKEIVVEALCTPTICSNVLNQEVKTVSNHYEHFKNLRLADFSNEINKCINVFIGVDYYYSRILGESKKEGKTMIQLR